ncbi:MAG TPA: TetR/AcrR family transcriptional regulator [Acidobacteriota bacterium]|nr:TetR/AcrR family transcriptional regulator [Acidobacteriota bacterium]HRR26407.1 TetR/AcrR family transcriptional regulator [Acidobacteriota bacterium]HRV07906.1 TetR/AcrR family transcriptional regulator [Acidobacteriota bacterium]
MIKKPPGPLCRREKRRLQLREEILDAALDLFAEKGFYAVTMHEVADRAEVGVGTLYSFFTSKEDLYRQLVLEYARSIFALLREALADSETDPKKVLEDFVTTGWTLLSSDYRVLKLYLAETQGVHFSMRLQVYPELKKEYERLTGDLEVLMARGVAEKLFRPVGERNLALVLHGISHAFFMEWLRDPTPEAVQENIRSILDLFYRGALAEPEPSPQ